MAGSMTMNDLREYRLRRAERVVAGTSTLEAAAGAAGVVLPILGLLGVAPIWMMGITSIVLGTGLFVEGAALLTERSSLRTTEMGTAGAAAQLVGGAVGLVLGIIGMVTSPHVGLLAVSILALGLGTSMAAGATERASDIGGRDESGQTARATRGSARAEGFAGLAAIGLGILALALLSTSPLASMTLVLVAGLGLGSSVFLAGSSLVARMAAMLRQ
jgi:hypothetical protein